MPTALDYSQGRPTAAAVRQAGHVGVVRYIGTPGRLKNLTRAEYLDMTGQGLGVALVYENHAGDAGGGYAAGQTAARTARADANSVGFPSTRPIYFAVDSDQVTAADFAAVSAYLDGIASVLGDRARVGVYGEYDVIERNVGSHARLGWQTAAWSGGRVSSKAALFQRLGQVYVGGIQSDVSEIKASDWGQHNAQEDDMQLTDKVNMWTGAAKPQYTVEECLASAVGWAETLGKRLDTSNTAIGNLTQLVLKGADVDEVALARELGPVVTAAIAAKDFTAATPEEVAAAVKAMLHQVTGGAQ